MENYQELGTGFQLLKLSIVDGNYVVSFLFTRSLGLISLLRTPYILQVCGLFISNRLKYRQLF